MKILVGQRQAVIFFLPFRTRLVIIGEVGFHLLKFIFYGGNNEIFTHSF